MSRSAWIDQTILGNPIGCTPQGVIYQHETSPDADGQPLLATFQTGYFYIAEGEDFSFVDQIIPDFKYGAFGTTNQGSTEGTGATIQLYFNVLNYPGDTPTTYGPYYATSITEYITVRFRGRLMAVSALSGDIGSFWRLGKILYRFAPAGRR
jgi:hypothetical protein